MIYDDLYPEHDRTSCSDQHPVNAEAAGSNGCARCTALAMEVATEFREAAMALLAADIELNESNEYWHTSTVKGRKAAHERYLKAGKRRRAAMRRMEIAAAPKLAGGGNAQDSD